MKSIKRWLPFLAAVVLAPAVVTESAARDSAAPIAVTAVSSATLPKGFTEKTATVNGIKLNYMIGGEGPPVVLLHGFAETSHMWLPIMPQLSKNHTVIVPDLPGAGKSGRPASGYDKKSMAKDLRALVTQLGIREPVKLVGHDIGLMVAYAYAAQFPNDVQKLVLMDAFLPGVGDWKSVWLMADLWHFHFYGPTAEALVKGRERTYLDHFWNDFAADRTKSVSEADRRLYAAAYASDGGMRATMQYFKTFDQDAKDFAGFSRAKLGMPVLVLAGEKSGPFLIEQGKLVATDVQGRTIKGSGHWLMEEAPQQTMQALVQFLNEPLPDRSGKTAVSAPAPKRESQERLSVNEAQALDYSGGGPGTSGLKGISTTVLKGDPTKPGVYTIMLRVPANTRIQAHSHPDDRVATVVSGTWYFGYGSRFDEKSLKALSPGSFYTEPPNDVHFASTGNEDVVLHITGMGPTGTTYVGSAK